LFISLWVVAYRRSMPVNSSLPPRCLHSTALSASALEIRSLYTVPFPFTLGDTCTRRPIVIRAAWINPISSLQSGCDASKSACCLSKDATISAHLVSHTVGPAIPPTRWYSKDLPSSPTMIHSLFQ
jgi:hypothetical protein